MEIIQQTIEGEMVTVNFSYAALTQENQIFLRTKENQIKRSADNISMEFMSIGRDLVEAKDRLPHGHFEQWVNGNLPFGERQAQQLMNVVRDPNANRYSLLGFNLSVQKQLAAPSTPAEVKEAIMTQAEAGAVITKEAVTKAVAEAATRFCPNCNNEQVIKAKALQYPDNTVQCSNCKVHFTSNRWMTAKGDPWRHCRGCNSFWRKENGLAHITYEPNKVQRYNCTEEKYCPICERKAKKIKPTLHCTACNRLWQETKHGEAEYRHSPAGETVYKDFEQKTCPDCTNNPKRYCPNCGHEARVRANMGYFTTCIHCQTSHKYEEWLHQPCHVRYCRHCNQKSLIPLDCFEKKYYVLCKNKACGKEELAGDWLTEPPPQQATVSKQLTTALHCPECNNPQEVLSLRLDNETIVEKGMLKCEQCQRATPLKSWGKEPVQSPPQFVAVIPEPDKIITWADMEAERRREIVAETAGLELDLLNEILGFIRQLKEN